jgi:IS5 family transposase
MHKVVGQPGFADAFVAGSRRGAHRLERIAALLDWSLIAALLAPLHGKKTGRPGYPPALLFRALLLAQWYRLSDPELEEALADRVSFRRFVGLSLTDDVPDETTLCRFRGALVDAQLAERLMAEINRQLDARGLMLKTGTLIDASVVHAAVRTPAEPRQPSPHDPDANWVSHGKGRSRFGYKMHAAVDFGSGLIRKVLLTPASTHDSKPADALIMGDEKAVYADRAYDKKARRTALRKRGIRDRLMHKGQRNRPITRWQKRRNRLIASIRVNVERTFGTLKRGYGFTRVRYRGLLRNHAHLQLLCAAFNLKRASALPA